MSRKARAVKRFREKDGFTALELLLTVGILGVLSSIALFQIGQSLPGLRGDGAMRVLMAQMTTARETAITQRHIMRLNFINGNQVQIVREETTGSTLTVLSSALFESGARFSLVSGVPDTPDAFGNSSAVYFNAATQVRFGADGMLIDQSGNPLNGTVFVSIPNQPLSFRAVTVLGTTGRVRGYRWDGRQWKQV